MAEKYEEAKKADGQNESKSHTEAVVKARAKQVLGKEFKYLFEVYHGTPHAGWTRWKSGHRGTTGLGYAYFAPRVITAAEYAETYGQPNNGLTDVRDMQRFGISEAVYHMVVGMNNPLIVDCRRASWNNIRMKNKRTVRTDEILNVLRFGELGYDGVIFLNVHDSQLNTKVHGYDVDVVPLGPVGKNGKNGDVAKQMKSLDGVTVSDVNVPEFFGAIDILDRFDVRNPDIRWSTEDVDAPRFSETREGKRIVAALVDNLIAHQADLAFGNEALAERLAQKGNAGVGKWNKVTRVSENGAVLPGSAEELAREEAFRAWQFGRPGGEDLKGLVRACGGAANWLDVVGTAYEVLSAIRSGNLLGGLNKTVAERFGKNEKEAVGWYVQRIVSARATDFGQKCYLMGRKFATDLMREANASAIAKLRREYKGKLSEERGKTRKAKERARGLERTAERRKANLRAAEAKIDFIKAEADLLYSEAMRKIFRSGLALLLAAFAGGGCIWNRAKVNDAGVAARAAAIVPGETRVEALPALMGCEPSAIVPLRDGRVVHVFGYGDAKTEGFTLLLVTFTKTNSAFSAVYVFADAEGVVRRVSAAPAPGVAWETWPFGE